MTYESMHTRSNYKSVRISNNCEVTFKDDADVKFDSDSCEDIKQQFLETDSAESPSLIS